MANVKITQLAADTNPASTDVLPFVDISADETKKVTIADLLENAGDGSASAPAFAFDDDSNTGIYRPGADQLAISTGGAGRLFIDSAGNCGIGVSSPATTLELKSDANAQTTAAIPTLRITNSDGSAVANDITGSVEFYSSDTSDPNHVSGYMRAISETSAGVAYSLAFGTKSSTVGDAAEKLRITSAGLVGINETSPAGSLHVDADSGVDGPIFDSGGSGNANHALLVRDSANSQLFRVNNNGNCGIGTSSPNNLLDVRGDSNPQLKVSATNTGTNSAGLYIENQGQRNWQIWADRASDQFRIGNNGRAATNIAIDSAGRLLVGTSTASGSSSLQVAGKIATLGTDSAFGTDSIPTIYRSGSTAGSYPFDNFGHLIIQPRADGAPRDIVFATGNGGTNKTVIDSSGRLLLGTSTTSAAASAIFEDNSADNGPSIVYLSSSATTPADGAGLGLLRFSASNHSPTAQIAARRDGGTWTAGSSQPSRIEFSTTADSASTPTERMRITSTGQVRLAGAGITFNGDTATANELDDYEEGTWTPSVEFGGATTGITYNARQGYYVKTGKVVHVWLYFNLSNKGSATGTATVAGLPFTSEDFNVSGLTTWPGSKPNRRQNETSSDFAMAVLENNSEVSISNGAGSVVTNSTFTNGTIIECALCYRAA